MVLYQNQDLNINKKCMLKMMRILQWLSMKELTKKEMLKGVSNRLIIWMLELTLS